MSARTNGSVWKLAAQLVGFLVGLALLGWCVNIAFAPENREQLDRLLDATPGQVLAMLGLGVLTMLVNGLIFWVVLRPSVRLPVADVLATNAIATFLGYLPFKLGMLARVMIHNRRDRVPLMTISAWLGAWVVAVGLTLGPMGLAAVLRPEVDALWIGAVALGTGLGIGATVLIARRYRGEKGEQRLRGWARGTRIKALLRLMETGLFRTAHDGMEMLCNPVTLGAACLLRGLDMTLQGGRFLVAAWVLGVELSAGEAVLIAVAYFLIGAATPIGVLGSREAGVVALAAAMGLGHLAGADADGTGGASTLAILALFVTGTETVAFLACAGAGAAWLRIDRLLLKGRWREAPEDDSDSDPSGASPSAAGPDAVSDDTHPAPSGADPSEAP